MNKTPERISYRINELVKITGIGKRTIERAVADGRLKSTKALGPRMILAQSFFELFGPIPSTEHKGDHRL